MSLCECTHEKVDHEKPRDRSQLIRTYTIISLTGYVIVYTMMRMAAKNTAAATASAISGADITVTRTVTTWNNASRHQLPSVVMTIPKDVAELVGVRVGDKLSVTGNADGEILVRKADKIGNGGR